MPGGNKTYAEVACAIHGTEEANDQTRVKRFRVGLGGKLFHRPGCPACIKTERKEARETK